MTHENLNTKFLKIVLFGIGDKFTSFYCVLVVLKIKSFTPGIRAGAKVYRNTVIPPIHI